MDSRVLGFIDFNAIDRSTIYSHLQLLMELGRSTTGPGVSFYSCWFDINHPGTGGFYSHRATLVIVFVLTLNSTPLVSACMLLCPLAVHQIIKGAS